MNEKIEINKKLIGKSVKILEGLNEDGWIGIVTDVVDSETFLVSNGETNVKVDIFDIRSLN